MDKLTEIYTIRFSEKQAESLQKLKDYDVNVSQFIRYCEHYELNEKMYKIK